MSEPSEAVLIVTLLSPDDFQAAKKQISKIKGVRRVELYGLSGKLRVKYDGDPKKNLAIQAKIRKVIETYR
jgi:hypothetical protein